MNNKIINFQKLIQKRIIIIISLIVLLVLSLILIIFFIGYSNNNHNMVMDVFGRERMLTQMISKDVNRKYAIMLSLQTGPIVETEQSLNDKIALISKSLKNSKDEFENTLSFLDTGKFKKGNLVINFRNSLRGMSPIINETASAWFEFSKSLDVITNANIINKEVTSSLIYINSHNEQLLNNCDQITQSLIYNQKINGTFNMAMALFMFILSLILLIISIFQLHKYIIEPLNIIYNGISNNGLLKNNIKISIPTKNDLLPVINEINDRFDKLNKIIDLIENINQDTSFDGILKYIYLTFSEFIPYSHIGIALLKNDGKILEASYGISNSKLIDLPKKLLGLKVNVDETSLGKIIVDGSPRVINDLKTYTKNSNNLYNKILIKEGVCASITLPLKINNKPVGVIFFSSEVKNIYQQQHISFLETIASSIAISLNKNIFIDELLFSTILALAKMAESRDEDTGEHLERMKQYSVLISEFLLEDHIYEGKISIDFLRQIERFSPMHDIGKVGIIDDILLKPGKLTFEEFEVMKKHAIYGADVLRTAESNIIKQNRSLFKVGIEIAEGHHEKWDGTGYPYNKSGEDIPLSARIIAIADVFDALTSKRPYKEAFSFEDSFNIIVDGKGKHFDPNIVEAFIKNKDAILKLYKSFK